MSYLSVTLKKKLSQFYSMQSFKLFDCIFPMVRHLVYDVLDTSKELPSPIRPMLVSVFAYFHQGSKHILHVHLRCSILKKFSIIPLGHDIKLFHWWLSLSINFVLRQKIILADSLSCLLEHNITYGNSIVT